MNGQIEIKFFNLDNINMTPIIIKIAKRSSGISWRSNDICDKENTLRIGIITRKNNKKKFCSQYKYIEYNDSNKKCKSWR